MLGLFSGSSALFGILATFVSASIVKRFGIFKVILFFFPYMVYFRLLFP